MEIESQHRLSTDVQNNNESPGSSSGSEPEDCTPDHVTTPAGPRKLSTHSVGASRANVLSRTRSHDTPIFHLMHHDYTEQPGQSESPGTSSEATHSGFRQQTAKRQRLSTAHDQSDASRVSSPENMQQPNAIRPGLRGHKISRPRRHEHDKDEGVPDTLQSQKRDTNQNDLNQKLLSLLECPVCLEYIRPPVVQCLNGHLICNRCRKRVSTCPTCRARFSDVHNFAMDVVAGEVEYPCSNVAAGCQVTLKTHEYSDHESVCKYRLFDCVIGHCQWGGLLADYLYHTVNKHPEMFIYGSSVILTLPLSSLNCVNWIVAAHNEIFRVNFTASNGVHINGCVQLVGADKRARQFQYILKVPESPQKETRTQIVFSRAVHEYVKDCSDIYVTGDCFTIPEKTATVFASGSPGDYIIPLRLHIIQHDL